MPRAFNKNQLVLLGSLKIAVNVLQKTARVAIGKSVKRANQQRSAMLYRLHLREIPLGFNVHIIQRIAKQSLVCHICRTAQPAKQFKGQNFLPTTVFYIMFDHRSFLWAD